MNWIREHLFEFDLDDERDILEAEQHLQGMKAAHDYRIAQMLKEKSEFEIEIARLRARLKKREEAA